MLYKVCLKQKTELVGNGNANSLFGAFLTAYSAVEELTDEKIQDIVLSDLLPRGVVPCGITKQNTVYSEKYDVKTVSVNRTLMSRENDGNNVPVVAFGKMGIYWDMYISTNILNIDKLTKIVDLMLVYGIGKWRNVGKGQFERVGKITICDIKTDAKKFVAFSSFVPDDSLIPDIIEAGYKQRNAMATNGRKQAPVVLFLPGTTFKVAKQIVGHHVYDENSQTYIHGKAIVMGV